MACCQGSAFFNLLSKFSAIRHRHDQLFESQAFPLAPDREAIGAWVAPDRSRIGRGLDLDSQYRTHSLSGRPIRRSAGPPAAPILVRWCHSLTPAALEDVDRAVLTAFESGADATVGDVTAAGGDIPPATTGQKEASSHRLATMLERTLPAGGDLSAAVALGLAVAERRHREAPERSCLATTLWPEIVARTDELYLAAEGGVAHFDRVLRAFCVSVNVDPDAKMGGGKALAVATMKGPVRLHQKACDEYGALVGGGELPEAYVEDLVRARLTLTKGGAFLKIATALQNGYRTEAGGVMLHLELVRALNRFSQLDPTHFRRIVFSCCLNIAHPNGTRTKLLCELEMHHLLLLQYHEVSDARAYYLSFGSHLRFNYEAHLKADLDFVLERRMALFDEVGKTPVLLSMLILVLGTHGTRSEDVRLPADLFELYLFAMNAAVARHFSEEEREPALAMLRAIATANHLVQRRTFTLQDVGEALAATPSLLALWGRLLTEGAVPLVKVLALGDQTGEFQFKHLSFQEALFVQAAMRGDAAAFWSSDAVAARVLGTPFFTNALRIGKGHLGGSLAQLRPCWDFSQHPLSERGWAALQELLLGAVGLVSLTLPLTRKAGLRLHASDDAAALFDGSASTLFSVRSIFSSALPSTLCRAFRGARVHATVSWARPLSDQGSPTFTQTFWEHCTLHAQREQPAANAPPVHTEGVWGASPLKQSARGSAEDEWTRLMAGPDAATTILSPETHRAGDSVPPPERMLLEASTPVTIGGLAGRSELNGQSGHVIRFDHARGRYAVQLTGEAVMVKADNLTLAQDGSVSSATAGGSARASFPLPLAWFTQDTAASSLTVGVALRSQSASITVDEGSIVTFDKADDTAPLLGGLRLLREAAKLDEALCARLLEPFDGAVGGPSTLGSAAASAGVTRWDALARHAGAASLVDDLVRQVRAGNTPNALR